jgi:hypothetical protein
MNVEYKKFSTYKKSEIKGKLNQHGRRTKRKKKEKTLIVDTHHPTPNQTRDFLVDAREYYK